MQSDLVVAEFKKNLVSNVFRCLTWMVFLPVAVPLVSVSTVQSHALLYRCRSSVALVYSPSFQQVSVMS